MGRASGSAVSAIAANRLPVQSAWESIPQHSSGARPNGSDGSFGPQKDQSSHKARTTDFCALPDGSLVELVRDQTRAKGDLNFLIWNGKRASVVDHFDHGGYSYIPPTFDEKLAEDLEMRLPSGVTACPAAKEIFLVVSQLIRTLVDLPESSICLVAAFILSTWFVDKLTVAPYLWVCGPPGSGKTRLLRLLHCLCRRAVLIGGAIPSRVYSLPALLRPTLLLDELKFNGTQNSHTLESWLRTGNARGVPVTAGGQLVDSFGAKVLCSRHPASDTALASRALHIAMFPTRKNMSPLDEETVGRIANDYQPRFLMFRLQHYREFSPGPVDLSLLSPRMADLLCALTLPLRDVEEVLPPLIDAVRDQELRTVIERANEPEGLVVAALFSFCHLRCETVLVGQIASGVNACRKRLGEETDLKPRAVGSILKSLGLATDKLDSFGRGLRLTAPVKHRIHELMQSYSLESQNSVLTERCALCKEMLSADCAKPPKAKVRTAPA